jgi:hypothetical protein
VVSTTDPYGRILRFLYRSRYYFFEAAPQLYSRGWVDPVPGPLLLRKSDRAGNRTGPPDMYPGTLTTRPQRRSTFFYITYKIQFVPHRKHNTSPLYSQGLWPLDHRGGPLTHKTHIHKCISIFMFLLFSLLLFVNFFTYLYICFILTHLLCFTLSVTLLLLINWAFYFPLRRIERNSTRDMCESYKPFCVFPKHSIQARSYPWLLLPNVLIIMGETIAGRYCQQNAVFNSM